MAARKWFDESPHDLPPIREQVDSHGTVSGIRTWDSMADFAADAAKLGKSAYKDHGNFAKATYAESLTFARDGWEGDRELIAAIAAHVTRVTDATTIGEHFQTFHDVAGSAIDMGRFMEGQPECMVEVEPVKIAKRGKVVRVVVPGSYRGDISAESITARGAAIVALIEAMTKSHYSVEVWSVVANHAHGRTKKRLSYAVKVQDAAQPVDIAKISFAIGHPAFNRQLVFAVKALESEKTAKAWESRDPYGSGFGVSPRHADHCDLPEDVQGAPVVILPELSNYGQPWTGGDPVKIARWIEATVKAIQDGDDIE